MTRFGIMFEQGEIVIVPIPFTNLTSNKRRPALVISVKDYNYKTDDLIVMAITSNLTDKEYCININNYDMETGDLLTDSQIRVDKIYTLSQSIVLKSIGKVNFGILEVLNSKFNEIINVKNNN